MADIDGDGSGDIDFREFTEWFLRMEMDELREIEDALMYHEIVEQAEVCAALRPLRRPSDSWSSLWLRTLAADSLLELHARAAG